MTVATRRDFVTASSLGIAALAGAVALGTTDANEARAEEAPGTAAAEWADAADLIVVGGGGAGFSAAIEAARAGASVLVLEKNDFCGGDTVRSGGMVMAGGTQIQKDLGIDDTVEAFEATELGYCGDACDRAMVSEMCLASPDEIQFMADLGLCRLDGVNIGQPLWAALCSRKRTLGLSEHDGV